VKAVLDAHAKFVKSLRLTSAMYCLELWHLMQQMQFQPCQCCNADHMTATYNIKK